MTTLPRTVFHDPSRLDYMSLSLRHITLLKYQRGPILNLALALKWVGPTTTLHQPLFVNYRGLRWLLTLNLIETNTNIGQDVPVPTAIILINLTIRLSHPDGGVDVISSYFGLMKNSYSNIMF